MLRILSALLVLGLTQAKSAPVCQVSDWSPWTQCVRVNLCPQEPDIFEMSYSVPVATEDYDDGRARMSILKARKDKQFKEAVACRTAGTCPEFMVPPSVTGALTECVGGMAGQYPCSNVDMSAFLNFAALCVGTSCGSARGNDIWGWTDPSNGDEYAIMGLTTGSSFVRITDPVNPVVVGYLPSRTSSSTWRDMKVYKDHVFIVSEASRHGMQVVDLTRFRGVTQGSVIQPDATYTRFGNAHNIALNEESGYAYVIGQTSSTVDGSRVCTSPGGLHIIDLANPKSPTYAGCWNNDGYTHDTQCVNYHGPDTTLQGRELCFSSNENTLTITDVTNKNSMVMLSRTSYTGYAYTHQAWLTEDHTILLLDDELDEQRSSNKKTRTYIWDVQNPRSPVLRRTFYSGEDSIDHNQYIKGDLTYQANYEAGLRILEVDYANHDLTEVAYFDCFPSRTTANFNGAWSTYPYYSSGNVVVSSIDYGLFVLTPNYGAMKKLGQHKRVHNAGIKHRGRYVETPATNCPDLYESKSCDAGAC